MKKFMIYLMLMMPLAHAADENGSYAIWGVGKKSCFSYNKSRDSGDDSTYRNYLMGYLTAFNTQADDTYRISGGMDMFGVLNWIDEYCQEKPVHGFDQAVVEFIVEQFPKRYKRARGSGRR